MFRWVDSHSSQSKEHFLSREIIFVSQSKEQSFKLFHSKTTQLDYSFKCIDNWGSHFSCLVVQELKQNTEGERLATL